MRRDTRTSLPVLGGPPDIVVDPLIASKSNNGLHVSVCSRCSDTIFSPVTWAHLRGDTLNPSIPEFDGEKADYHITNVNDSILMMTNVGPNPKKRGPMVDFFLPAKDISESSNQSCGFCKFLTLLAEGHNVIKGADEEVVLRLQAIWPEKVNGSLNPMMLEVGLHPNIKGGGPSRPLLFYKDSQGVSSGSSGDLEQPLNHEIFVDLLDQAEEWLWTCESTHVRCSYTETHKLPTRILDLMHFWDQGCIHLIETTNIESSYYAMLSYVWGSSASLRLDENSHSELRSGISAEQLPRTIRDAVLVAASLHIRYLWVDALCIFQDSLTDKNNEIPQMCEYYKNAAVVISASGAKDVHSGLGFRQDGPHSVLKRLQNVELLGSVPLWIPGHFSDYSTSLLVDMTPRLYDYRREPINNRAWTLQESILPKRLLTFPRTGGLSMTCLEGESLAGEIVSDPYYEVPAFSSLGVVSSHERTGEELFELWTKMVEDYTQRSLSYRSDTLVAIGALAREMHTRHSDLLGRYLGGLWENFIRSGLLWYNVHLTPAPRNEQSNQYIAPSWSWASCPQRIVLDNKPEIDLLRSWNDDSQEYMEMKTPQWLCQVLGSDVTPKSELDSFGALASGYLTIQAVLRPLRRHSDQAEGDIETGNRSPGFPTLYVEGASGPATILTLDQPLVISDHSGSEDAQYYWLGIWYAGRARARGLLVHQIDERSFQRLGYAVFQIEHETFLNIDLSKERIIQLV